MRKVLLLVLVIALCAFAAAAQDPTLGVHDVGQQGCMSCHAPHNTKLSGKNTFLWNLNIPTSNYQTYNSTLSVDPATAGTSTAFYSVLCMSCHDTNTTNASMTGYTWTSDNNKIANDTPGLTNDHPINVQYASGTEKQIHWKINIDATTKEVTFADTANNDAALSYGHPAKLFAIATDKAYVECASCHNPHSQTKTVYKQGGTVKSFATIKFLRGEYGTADKNTAFCRSCHADKSANWTGAGDQ